MEYMSQRLQKLPKYLFAEIDEIKERLKKEGKPIINLSIGDPDLPTPSNIVKRLQVEAEKVENQKYPSYQGHPLLREAISRYMKRRFGVDVDPEKEVLVLIGSKEGIAHIPLGLVNPGDIMLVPDPGYPVYYSSSILALAIPYKMPLRPENHFLIDLKEIPKDILKKARLIFVNYPNNPTSVEATKEFYKELVEFAIKHKIIVVSDAAYIEMYDEDFEPPFSIFEIDGAKEIAIEMHSFSKTFCMTGWRLGFAVGNKYLIEALLKTKTQIDSGVFDAIQLAGVEAMDSTASWETVSKYRKIFSERRNFMRKELEKLGFEVVKSHSTFYLWVKTPENYTSMDFVKKLMEEAYIITTPGIGFGEYGEGYFRIALTVDVKILEEAIERIRNLNL